MIENSQVSLRLCITSKVVAVNYFLEKKSNVLLDNDPLSSRMSFGSALPTEEF